MLQFFEVPPGGSVVSLFFSFFLLFVFAALVGSHFFRIFFLVCFFLHLFCICFVICFFCICVGIFFRICMLFCFFFAFFFSSKKLPWSDSSSTR